jgi:isoquinoline 1-oxidoreductase subunit beta
MIGSVKPSTALRERDVKPLPIASRRDFLETAGALVFAFALPAIPATAGSARSPTKGNGTDVNAFVRVDADGIVTLIIGKSEMGQGIYTGYAQLIGEELEVDWRAIRVESAPVAVAYNSPGTPYQFTGGSDSTLTGFSSMREAGAAARLLLIAAAAERLHVPQSDLVAEKGSVVHRASGRRLGYGGLAARAAQLPVPTVTLKSPSEWRLIGQPLPRVDSREKSTGAAVFGLDVRLPRMHYALVARAPTFGATLVSFDAAPAKAIADVVAVVSVPTGIAVIATNSWAARRGRDALKVEWSKGAAAGMSTTDLAVTYAELSLRPGTVAFAVGDVAAASASHQRHLVADYATPYLAHACMEPMNCTVAFTGDACHIYTGTQGQSPDRDAAAEVSGLPTAKVHLHTTLLGGGFGRRGHAHADFVREAVSVAKAFPHPVMTVWSREDDMQHDSFRPQAHNRLTATLGADGLPATWAHTQVVQPLYVGTALESVTVDPKTGLDSSTHDGASDIPYAIPNIRVDVHQQIGPVPVMWMRSVGHSVTAFAIESFIDECAHAAEIDPLEYRLALLKDKPRHIAVLKLAAEKAGWGTKLPAGHARGIAVHQMSGATTVAQVAEVSLVNGKPHVHRVVVAIDCGLAVNPRSVAQQLEGAVNFGLSAALFAEITLEDGHVLQSNFNDYKIVRFRDAPTVEAYIVPSTEPPSGVGQEAVPPIAPAVANALFSLTGVRARRLPLKYTAFNSARA